MIRHAAFPPFDTEHLELRRERDEARAEAARLADELARLRGGGSGDLLRICVAAMHLQASLDPARVLVALAEVAASMLDAGGYALVEFGSDGLAVTDAHAEDGSQVAVALSHPAVHAAAKGRWLLPTGGVAEPGAPCACVPLVLEGRPAGALALFGLPVRPLPPGDRRLLEMLSTTLPLALRAARLHAAHPAT